MMDAMKEIKWKVTLSRGLKYENKISKQRTV